MGKTDMVDAVILCETAYEQELSRRAYAYVCYPEPQTLAGLKQTLFSENSLDVAPIRKAALAIQAANAALLADFQQVTEVLRQQGQALACEPGCTGCCHQLVLCYPFETELIGHYLHSRPDLLAFFSHAWREWDTRTASFRAGYLQWAEKYYKEAIDDGTFTLQDYYIPCPFLQDDLCKIYPARPYACRSCVALDTACHYPQGADEKPGSHTLDFGSFTPHKKARTTVIGLLWRVLGVRAADVKSRPMVEQVRMWLESGAGTLLK